jgi:3-polyprenyl-4-hydroxybenzoate decarboxylase
MRSWIKQLEEAGELIRITKPVHPHTQMGALLYQSREKGLLFENLDGFPGWRSLGMAPANLRHAAIAFDTSIEKLIPTAAERTLKRRPVELVSTGPVKEVIQKDDQVDLTKLPAHVAGSEEKCETNDLEVPFDAEIVLEGRILPNVREDEGPFSEFHDYYVAGMGKNPVIEIDCITRRHDAIFKAIQNGSEVEGCVFHKVPFGVAVYNHIKNIGGYVNLHNLLVLPGLFGIVVQMTPRFYGEAKQILMGVLSSPILHPKVAIGVDEDVNIFNYWEVLWAINTRCNPQDDIIVIPGTRTHPMDPTGVEPVPPGGPYWHRVGGKVIIDATKPPLCAGEQARQPFQRLKPKGWETVRLEDFLPR